jgi:hypothetical protein
MPQYKTLISTQRGALIKAVAFLMANKFGLSKRSASNPKTKVIWAQVRPMMLYAFSQLRYLYIV